MEHNHRNWNIFRAATKTLNNYLKSKDLEYDTRLEEARKEYIHRNTLGAIDLYLHLKHVLEKEKCPQCTTEWPKRVTLLIGHMSTPEHIGYMFRVKADDLRITDPVIKLIRQIDDIQ